MISGISAISPRPSRALGTTRARREPWTAARAVAIGALAVGLLDGLDALLFFGLRGAPPIRIFQAVASGLLGRAAFAGGWATFALGVALHFSVASAIVSTYILASWRHPLLTRSPIACGLVFGVVAFFVMQWVVVPLSAATAGPRWPSWPVLANGVLGHALLVGLPAALVARASTPASAAGD